MLSLLFLDSLTLDFSYQLLQALKTVSLLPLPVVTLFFTHSCLGPGLTVCNLASEIRSRSTVLALTRSVRRENLVSLGQAVFSDSRLQGLSTAVWAS